MVSTIIPVYNRADLAQKALLSVIDQSYRPIEVILVDDGSNDGATPKALDKLASDFPDEIKVIHQKNSGPGLAREAGRLVARGEFIQYLDSDDWLLPGKFECQVQALQDHPECGIAYGITHLVDDQGNNLKTPSKKTGEEHQYLFPQLMYDRWWHTSSPLYRRSVSDAAGPWPDHRPEDWDLEARMGAARVKLFWCDVPVSCHREHSRPGRVSKGDHVDYLRDEAKFLPRLFQCARKAGVSHGTPAMNHFARWAFMRARQLGECGESVLADEMMLLAKRSSNITKFDMKLVSYCSRILGWRATGRISRFHDRIRDRGRK